MLPLAVSALVAFVTSGQTLRRFTTESGHPDRIDQVIDNTLLRKWYE